MKHLLWLALFGVFTANSKVYQLLDHKVYRSEIVHKVETQNELNIKFTIPSFSANQDLSYGILKNNFSSVKVKGLSNTKEVSRAALPYSSFIVKGFPSEYKVSLKKGKVFKLKDFRPSPAKELPCRCAKDKNLNPNIDLSKYEEGRVLYSIHYLGDIKGEHLSKVTLSPMSYKGEEMLIYPELEITLHKKNKSGISFDAEKFYQDKKRGKNFLIITPSQLLEGSNDLAEYKRSQGFKVKVVNLDIIGKSSAKLKSFLHKEYKLNGFSYALLVGHEKIMPTEYVLTSADMKTPSDKNYFTMGGEEDLLPDVFYGRIVADKNSEVRSQLKKIKEYDRQNYAQAIGQNHFVGIASNEGADPTDVEYMQGFAKEFEDVFDMKTSFFFQDSGSSTAMNINKALNSGSSWLSYIGHGSGDSWSSVNRGEYKSSDVKGLNFGIVKPVIIDVACQNGRFSYEGRLGERFMNEMKDSQPIGAVAYYGGSVDISWHPPAIMAKGINKAIAKDGVKELGQALFKGQLYLLEKYDDLEAAKENLIWYHLFGDPSMKLSFK